MTQRESGQDFDPKHRIVGAIVIVVFAVILIPIILSNRQSSPERPDLQPLAPGEPVAEKDRVAVTNLSPADSGRESDDAGAQPHAASAPTTATLPPTHQKKATASSAPPSTEARASDAASTRPDSGWVVQVGTFSKSANAARLEQKLRTGGHPLLVEHITLDGNKAVRLRVGPFRDRTAALKAQARIGKEVGVKGVVLAYP
jgi:DedD protein